MFFWPTQNPKWFSNHQRYRFNESIFFTGEMKHQVFRAFAPQKKPGSLGNLHKKHASAGGNVQFKTSGGGVQKFILTKRQPRVFLFHSKWGLEDFLPFFPPLKWRTFGQGCTHGSSRWISGGEVLVEWLCWINTPLCRLSFPRKRTNDDGKATTWRCTSYQKMMNLHCQCHVSFFSGGKFQTLSPVWVFRGSLSTRWLPTTYSLSQHPAAVLPTTLRSRNFGGWLVIL